MPRLLALAKGIGQAVEQNGGLRLKFATDDKGLVLMAAWGLQSRSFEDNAERALAAATLVHQTAQAAGLEASIGGNVFAGLLGSDSHRKYTVIGDAMNRAAALSSRSAGQIRGDEHTRESGARWFHFADAGVLHLKGQGAAAHYIVTSEGLGQVVQKGEMVGRTAERDMVDELVAQVGQGAAPGLFISSATQGWGNRGWQAICSRVWKLLASPSCG